jgi:hypothetical protein
MKKTLGFKLESTPYTSETLAADDYDMCVYNIEYDNDIAMMARKCARGDLSNDTSIAGKRMVTISFAVDLAYQGAVDTAPTYFKALKACALKQTAHGSTGISLVTNADYTKVPATIEVVEKDEGASPSQVVVKARGCMGNARFVLDAVGQPVRIEFEFKGVLESITDRAFGSILNPTGFDTNLPDAVLSASIEMFSEEQQLDTITIDLGNTVEVYADPAQAEGLEGGHVVSRNPTIECDPDLELIATQGDYSRWTGNTTGAFSMTVGSQMTLSAPAVQIIKAYTPGDREGHTVNTKSYELKRSSGNDEFKLLQGSET